MEYTFQSVSAHQIYTYFESTVSLYTENILSTLLNSLIQYCSVHWSMWIKLYSLDLFRNILIVLYHSTLKDIFSTLLNSLIRYCSVHWCIQSTLSSVYLFSKSVHILRVLYPFTLQISWVHCYIALYNVAVYTGLYRVHYPVYICSPNLYIF